MYVQNHLIMEVTYLGMAEQSQTGRSGLASLITGDIPLHARKIARDHGSAVGGGCEAKSEAASLRDVCGRSRQRPQKNVGVGANDHIRDQDHGGGAPGWAISPMIMDGLATMAGCGGLAAAGAVGGVGGIAHCRPGEVGHC